MAPLGSPSPGGLTPKSVFPFWDPRLPLGGDSGNAHSRVGVECRDRLPSPRGRLAAWGPMSPPREGLKTAAVSTRGGRGPRNPQGLGLGASLPQLGELLFQKPLLFSGARSGLPPSPVSSMRAPVSLGICFP